MKDQEFLEKCKINRNALPKTAGDIVDVFLTYKELDRFMSENHLIVVKESGSRAYVKKLIHAIAYEYNGKYGNGYLIYKRIPGKSSSTLYVCIKLEEGE